MQEHKSWQVHCINGANRSVFFMVALVMAYCQVDAEAAYEHVRLLRNIADLEPKWHKRTLMQPLAWLVSHQERLHGLFYDHDMYFVPKRLPVTMTEEQFREEWLVDTATASSSSDQIPSVGWSRSAATPAASIGAGIGPLAGPTVGIGPLAGQPSLPLGTSRPGKRASSSDLVQKAAPTRRSKAPPLRRPAASVPPPTAAQWLGPDPPDPGSPRQATPRLAKDSPRQGTPPLAKDSPRQATPPWAKDGRQSSSPLPRPRSLLHRKAPLSPPPPGARPNAKAPPATARLAKPPPQRPTANAPPATAQLANHRPKEQPAPKAPLNWPIANAPPATAPLANRPTKAPPNTRPQTQPPPQPAAAARMPHARSVPPRGPHPPPYPPPPQLGQQLTQAEMNIKEAAAEVRAAEVEQQLNNYYVSINNL